jgi:hypothetical protein
LPPGHCFPRRKQQVFLPYFRLSVLPNVESPSAQAAALAPFPAIAPEICCAAPALFSTPLPKSLFHFGGFIHTFHGRGKRAGGFIYTFHGRGKCA